MKRPLVWLAFAAASLAALGAGTYLGQKYLRGDGAHATGGADPAAVSLLRLSLPDVHGVQQPFDQWRGKVLVVNFWATWCVPCREEMPEFVRAQKEFGAKGLQIVGIATDQQDKVARFAAEIGLNYPALIGGFGAMELSKTLGNRLMALPFTVVMGRDGSVAHTQLGPIKPQQLRELLATLL